MCFFFIFLKQKEFNFKDFKTLLKKEFIFFKY